jgi:hypothetical protein
MEELKLPPYEKNSRQTEVRGSHIHAEILERSPPPQAMHWWLNNQQNTQN